jgi:hypothetical protein
MVVPKSSGSDVEDSISTNLLRRHIQLVINNPVLAKFKIVISYCIHYCWFEIKFLNI